MASKNLRGKDSSSLGYDLVDIDSMLDAKPIPDLRNRTPQSFDIATILGGRMVSVDVHVGVPGASYATAIIRNAHLGWITRDNMRNIFAFVAPTSMTAGAGGYDTLVRLFIKDALCCSVNTDYIDHTVTVRVTDPSGFVYIGDNTYTLEGRELVLNEERNV